MRALPILILLLTLGATLPGCARTATLTNTTDAPIRASLERELIGSGNRTLDAATILPDATVTLGPVRIYTERVTLNVTPANNRGAIAIRERLGFGDTELTVVPDEFSPATIRLIEGPPDDSLLRKKEADQPRK
ncbi:MAG: hypothetical protein AAFR96_10490 [Planctomycetota bacterium]